MKAHLLALVAAAVAVIGLPASAEAKSYKHRYHDKHYKKHYYRHHDHDRGYSCREHGRHRHYRNGRVAYYYGPHYWAYGYAPVHRGINVHVNL